jgi:mRNA interferase MazF
MGRGRVAVELKRFDVYGIALNPTVGAEIKKTRPCVVISPDEMNRHIRTVIVAPLTTQRHSYPSRVRCKFKGRKAEIVLDQIRTVDRTRLQATGTHWHAHRGTGAFCIGRTVCPVAPPRSHTKSHEECFSSFVALGVTSWRILCWHPNRQQWIKLRLPLPVPYARDSREVSILCPQGCPKNSSSRKDHAICKRELTLNT